MSFRNSSYDIIIIGCGNAAMCAAIAALENGARVIIVEKAPEAEFGGNSRYTAGAMRFAYRSSQDLKKLLKNYNDPRLPDSEFGSYPQQQFRDDLEKFNGGKALTEHQHILVDQSYEAIKWLASHNVDFEPIYSRQTFQKDGKWIFWGGLTLATRNEGEGMVQAERKAVLRLGGDIIYDTAAEELLLESGRVCGVICRDNSGTQTLRGKAVVLGSGGFEANPRLRKEYIGDRWEMAKVRGSRHNMGKGIEMATAVGAVKFGFYKGCHAVPMDLNMPDYGNPDIPHIERKNYRKISYFLGLMLNARGKRFVDEGANFRNYTYAQYGKAVLDQPGGCAWQIFDARVLPLLYDEYRFHDASFVEADSLEELTQKLTGVDQKAALETLQEYNRAVDHHTPFDPSVLDGKKTEGLKIPKSNWANPIDSPPFRAYPVTCGITFTYGGLKVNNRGEVQNKNNHSIPGLYACGELVGGVFFYGYPGGSGLTSGTVFGRLAGINAAQYALEKHL